MQALESENATAQQMLKESKEVLKNAEEDAKEQLLVLPGLLEECDKTEAKADELAVELAARSPPATPHESHSQSLIISPSVLSAMSTP